MSQITINGHLQERVQALIDGLTASGVERGLQVAIYRDGRLVLDAWAGVADATSNRPVSSDTLFSVFSCSKGIAATVIHLLAERGVLDYDDPVSRYWPDFAQRGKERVTLRHVLTHTAGIPQMPAGVTPEAMTDWDGMCRAIAELPPLWRPGEKSAYHALTFGWILGEVAHRADGRMFDELVRQEIAQPMGIEDMYFGLPSAAEPRVATLESGPPPRKPQSIDSLRLKALPIAVTPTPRVYNRSDVRQAIIPAGGGIMTARSLARMYAALIGAVDGVRLLPAKRLAIATALQIYSTDEVLGLPIPKALGYFLGGPGSPMSEPVSRFGHPGAGGSIAFADPTRGLAFALVKNRLVWSDTPEEETGLAVARMVSELLATG